MDDLISRKAEINSLGNTPEGTFLPWSMAVDILESQPSIPAVPLDKLCEWLQDNAALTHGTLISAAGWKYELTRWMEGLDAAD